MTILFLSRLFYPHVGGVETHVLEVGKRLVKKGHRVIVITEEYHSDARSDKMTGEVQGIEIRRIDAGRENFFKKFRVWSELLSHKELIEKADVVHCHDVFFWYLPFRFLFLNKPIFITFHGYETKFPPSKRAIFIRKISEKLSFGNICVGEYIKKWYGTSPNYITYGGVDIENKKSTRSTRFAARRASSGLRLRGSDSRRLMPCKVEASKIKIVFIGRLEEDNGILMYLRALDILKKKEINFELEACGDGSLRSKVEKYGKVYGFAKDLNEYIEKADIVFASSYLSIMEAIIYKKLVFAVYDNPLKKDYLKMTPFTKWLVIEFNPEHIAKNILYYSTHPKDRNEKINDSFQWVKDQSWDKVVQLYVGLWNK